jgi:hypothetical protein
MQREQDILFGNCIFLDKHPGTKKWASILGTYSQQYYWSDSVYQKIRDDKRMEGRQYMMLLGSSKKFRLATEEEIEERTRAVFENGGGKKRPLKRRKTRHSLPSDDSAVGDVLNEFKVGDDVYAYDQLWSASIVEKSDFLDGTKYMLHYKGFRHESDSWVDALQLFPSNKDTSTLYQELDKSEIRAFENENEYRLEVVEAAPSTARQTRVQSRSQKRKDSGSSKKPANIPPSPAASSSPDPKPREEIFHRLVIQPPNVVVDMEEVVKQALSKCNTAVTLSNEAGIGCTVKTVMSGEAAKWSATTLSTIFSPTVLAALPHAKQMKDMATQQQQSNKQEEGGGLQRLAALAMERNDKKWKQAQKHLAHFVQCLVDDL